MTPKIAPPEYYLVWLDDKSGALEFVGLATLDTAIMLGNKMNTPLFVMDKNLEVAHEFYYFQNHVWDSDAYIDAAQELI